MKKLLISFLVGLTVFLSFAPYLSPAKAQTTWYTQSLPEWYLKVYDSSNPNEIFGERYTAAQVQWITYSIPSMLLNWVTNGNTDLGGCFMGITEASINVNLCANGIGSALANLKKTFSISENVPQVPSIASQIFADRPISGISYTRNVIRKFNPVTEVHAQNAGFGFNILFPVVGLWAISRNASFFLFVIVAIVFAFMIMFRVKLSPQVVISVQSALPKMIITLILATFSFAIAGLMIDLMYVIMGVFSTLITSMNIPLFKTFQAQLVFAFINGSLPILHDSGISIVLYFLVYIVAYVVAVVAAFAAAVSGLHVSSIIFSLLLLAFALILILILLWYILKTVYVLFKNLAAVYGLIIIAPLQITAGALFPQMGFGTWLKKLFSKLMVFPLTGIFIFFSYILLAESLFCSFYGLIGNNVLTQGLLQVGVDNLASIFQSFGLPVDSANVIVNIGHILPNSWGPPMLGNPASATAIAFLLMSVGLIMMIPKVSENIESFMAGKGFAGTAIGEAMGPFGVVGKVAEGAGIGYGATLGAKGLENYYENLVNAGKGAEQGIRGKAAKNLAELLRGMQKH